jgi:hypothetical protein
MALPGSPTVIIDPTSKTTPTTELLFITSFTLISRYRTLTYNRDHIGFFVCVVNSELESGYRANFQLMGLCKVGASRNCIVGDHDDRGAEIRLKGAI